MAVSSSMLGSNTSIAFDTDHYDGFTWFQQLIIHHTELVLQNAEHNLATVNIRSDHQRGDMSGHYPWLSALVIIVVESLFVAGHNAM